MQKMWLQKKQFSW